MKRLNFIFKEIGYGIFLNFNKNTILTQQRFKSIILKYSFYFNPESYLNLKNMKVLWVELKNL